MEEKKLTLQQVIERNDYVEITEELQDRSIELAELILKKMKELDLAELNCLSVKKVKANSGFSETFLCINYQGCLDVTHSFYYADDFNCKIQCATVSERIIFMNNAKKIIEDLEDYETSRTAQIRAALDDNKEL